MNVEEATQEPVLRALVEGLKEALGTRLRSVVLYGSAARGDYEADVSDLNVIVVLESLEPSALEATTPSVRRFVRQGHPIPRFFSPELIAASADTFPVEFADLRAGRAVLHGDDPFGAARVERDFLRLQVERELKEKMMRLREGYVLAHERPSALRRLLAQSYPAFVALFRAGLQLMRRPVPQRSEEVVAAFCDAAGLERGPFEEIARLRRGGKAARDPKAIFAGYHDALTRAAERVDRLRVEGGEGR